MKELDLAIKHCGAKALSLTLEWSEVDNLWYAEARGCGKGEWWEVKRAATPELALTYLIDKIKNYGVQI